MQNVLPIDWGIAKLGEVCDLFIDGNWIESKDQSESGIRLIQTGNIGLGEFIDKDSKKFITEETFQKFNCTEVFPGDILISRLPDPVGRSCIVPDLGYKCITAVDCTIVRVNKALISKHYLSFALNSSIILSRINKYLTGTTRARISRTNLEKIIIPLPPLPTQHKIVEILEEADNLRKLRQQADEKMKDLIPSLFVQIFGDPATNPKGWEVKTIGDIAAKEKFSIRMGPFGSQLKKHELVDEGFKVLWIENIVNNKFEWKGNKCITSKKYEQLKGFQVRPGDILTTTMGTIGRSCVVPNNIGKAIISSHLLKITLDPKIANPEFVAEYIRLPFAEQYFQKSSQGIVMQGLNTTIIKSLPIYFPPVSLQQEFAKLVEEIEAEKARQTESRRKVDELFSSLMQRAFTGELAA